MSAFLDVLRQEGTASALRRALDRIDDARRWPRAVHLPPGLRLPRVDVPSFLPGPLARRHGGVSVQLAERLHASAGNVALLTPRPSGLRLDVREDARWRAYALGGSLGPALEEAAERLSAKALHVEGAAGATSAASAAGGVLLEELAGLASRLAVLLSVHDFGLFCERPHLYEPPAGRFCAFSREAARCARCLGRAGGDPLAAHRERGERLLLRSRAVVFPSLSLRDAHRALFPEGGRLEVVIEPAAPGASGRPALFPRAPRHVAFVGRAAEHKGSDVFAAVARRLASRVGFSAFGGGRLPRGLPARAYGFYRPGSLPDLLRRRRVDLALLPSVVPEAFSLTLSECWAAGVPVLAFDHGAIAERIRRHGGGDLVPLASGAEGLIDRIARLLDGDGVDRLAFHDPPTLPTGKSVAFAHAELYRRLGLR